MRGVRKFAAREEWLGARVIGGSSAAAIVGLHPSKSSVDLFLELKGKKEPKSLDGIPQVEFGRNAEGHIRALFALRYPRYRVEAPAEGIEMAYRLDKPHMTATIDGYLTDAETGMTGILEIKTADINGRASLLKWEGGIPNNYYIQILHYLLVYEECQFAILYAMLSHKRNGEHDWQEMRSYIITREQAKADLEWLEAREDEFWNAFQDGEEPPVAVSI